MAKTKKKDSVIVVHDVQEFTKNLQKITEQLKSNTLPFRITKAKIKDDFCNYDYTIITGVGAGDSHGVKGRGIVERDMHEAFSKLNVHLAVIDDAFLRSNIEIEDINSLHGHDLTLLYSVNGIMFKGPKDAESVVLMGTKYVTCAAGRIELESPLIPLDNLSSYKFYEELKIAVEKARTEVALYKEGKYTPVEEPSGINDENQGKLFEEEEEVNFEVAKA